MKAPQLLQLAYKEDKKNGDITTRLLFPKARNAVGHIYSREAGILAGRREIELFLKKKLRLKFFVKDGAAFKKNARIAKFCGDVRKILKVERTVLNFLGRMSGIATKTRRVVEKARAINPRVTICATRKTLWGDLDKRAVQLGGGNTHRMNLGDAILIKDNHLDPLDRDIEKAIVLCHSRESGNLLSKADFFEIEVENIDEALRACRAFKKMRIPSFVMFDNFSPQQIRAALAKIKQKGLLSAVTAFEASGGITEKNIAAYAKTGVERISMGSLTMNTQCIDLTLKIALQKANEQ